MRVGGMSAPTITPLDAFFRAVDIMEALAPPCDRVACEHGATWAGITKCCGISILLCDEHKDWLLDIVASEVLFRCPCTVDHPGNPFVSLERL